MNQIKLPPLPYEIVQRLPTQTCQLIIAWGQAAIELDRQHLATEYRKELDKLSVRNYDLAKENAQLLADRQQRGEPVATVSVFQANQYVGKQMRLVSYDAQHLPLGDQRLYVQPAEPVKVLSDCYTNEETAQSWYDLAWEAGARRNLSFDGDEIVSINFDIAEFESFCRVLLAHYGTTK